MFLLAKLNFLIHYVYIDYLLVIIEIDWLF
jgi:hypothetical protein